MFSCFCQSLKQDWVSKGCPSLIQHLRSPVEARDFRNELLRRSWGYIRKHARLAFVDKHLCQRHSRGAAQNTNNCWRKLLRTCGLFSFLLFLIQYKLGIVSIWSYRAPVSTREFFFFARNLPIVVMTVIVNQNE